MPYGFIFDLTSLPQRVVGWLGKKERIRWLTETLISLGLELSDAIKLLTDLAEIETLNAYWKDKFAESKRRALFLPHCSRLPNCAAKLNAEVPTYVCISCTRECKVREAVTIARNLGYATYVIPGGSCVPRIIEAGGHDGVVGVACPDELLAASRLLMKLHVPGQAVPLLKNGCACTTFSLEMLRRTLAIGL